MAVTAFFYAHAPEFALSRSKAIDWDTSTIKIMLCTSTYVPNQDTHEDKADVTNEVVGTGYTAGGATLSSKTIGTTLNVLKLDAADVTWTTSTLTARFAVIYDDSGATDADKALIGWIDFGEDKSTIASTFKITFDSSGIGIVTPANAPSNP